MNFRSIKIACPEVIDDFYIVEDKNPIKPELLEKAQVRIKEIREDLKNKKKQKIEEEKNEDQEIEMNHSISENNQNGFDKHSDQEK